MDDRQEQLGMFEKPKTKKVSENCIRGSKLFECLGASNHTENIRQEDDFYATDPRAADLLIEQETFKSNIWEPACGQGHLSKVFEGYGYNVISSDLVDRGYGRGGVNFLSANDVDLSNTDIVTNPPYSLALEFIEHGLSLLPEGGKMAMFLKLQFLESKARRELFDREPFRVMYVFSSRISCAMNGDFEKYGSSAVAYAWYVWSKGFKGDPVIKWIN